jgi:hypothetical protein
MPAVFVHVVASATCHSGCLCGNRDGCRHDDVSLIDGRGASASVGVGRDTDAASTASTCAQCVCNNEWVLYLLVAAGVVVASDCAWPRQVFEKFNSLCDCNIGLGVVLKE